MVHSRKMKVSIILQAIQDNFHNWNKKSIHILNILLQYSFSDIYQFLFEYQSSKGSISRHNSGIILTGDSQIDADITAFINARKRIVNQMNKGN